MTVGHGEANEGCTNPPEIRDLTAAAKARKRLLRFLNEAQYPAQLLVAPNDRFTIEEEEHHTDHAEHFEHLTSKPLVSCEMAETILATRLREFGPRGFLDVDDVLERVPGFRGVFDEFVFSRFSTASYGRWDLLCDLAVGGTQVEIERAALLSTYEVVFLADGADTVHWDPSDEVTPNFALLDGATTGLAANLLCGGHTFLSDGRLLVVGGGGGFGPGNPTSNQGWKYDPVNHVWTQTAGA